MFNPFIFNVIAGMVEFTFAVLASETLVKNQPAMHVGSILGLGRTPGEENGNYLGSAWGNLWTEEPAGSMGSQNEHNLATEQHFAVLCLMSFSFLYSSVIVFRIKYLFSGVPF